MEMSDSFIFENFSDYYDFAGGSDNSFPYDGDIESLKKPWITTPYFIPTMIIYGLAFLVGVLGNILVIIVVMHDRKSRSVTTSFMVSLAVADVLFLCVCVPYEATKHVIAHWALGPILCKISEFIKMLSAVASILNLSSVSVERFIVIVLPMKSRRWCTAGNSQRILLIVWIISVLLSWPPLYIMNTEETRYYNNVTSVTLMFCTDDNIREYGRKTFVVYKLLIMFALPTVVMTVCYTGVIYALWISSQQLTQLTSLPSSNSSNYSLERVCLRNPKNNQKVNIVIGNSYSRVRCRTRSFDVLKARKQVIKMLIAVVLVFLLCWGPTLTMDTILKFSPTLGWSSPAFYAKITFGCLPYLQSCMNPFIYCFMSQKFRQSVLSLCQADCCIRALPRCCRHRRNALTVTFELDSKLTNGTTQSRLSVPNSRSGSSEENNPCLLNSTPRCIS